MSSTTPAVGDSVLYQSSADHDGGAMPAWPGNPHGLNRFVAVVTAVRQAPPNSRVDINVGTTTGQTVIEDVPVVPYTMPNVQGDPGVQYQPSSPPPSPPPPPPPPSPPPAPPRPR